MSTKQETITREVCYCDYCGVELTKQTEGEFFFVAHCNGDVCYEGEVADICKECAESARLVFCKQLSMPAFFSERYDDPREKEFSKMELRKIIKTFKELEKGGV